MISLEAILLFATGFAGANLLGSKFISPYFDHGGGLLAWHIAALLMFLIYVVISAGRSTAMARRRFWFTVLAVGLFVLTALVRQINLRQPDGQPIGIHDGAVQTEIAADIFLHGHNPYDYDYRGTAYQVLNPRIPEGPAVNVVWSHYIYPPLTFVVLAPWRWAAQAAGLFGDIRILLMAALGLTTWLIVRTTPDWTMRTRLFLLSFGNPFIWLYVVAGYNDILMVLALVAMAAAWVSKKWEVVGITFALALGMKQSAWILIPLLIITVVLLWPRQPKEIKTALRYWLGTTALIFGPWLLWNASALYDDIVRYASGSIPYSYPVSGATALQYLHLWHLIPSPWTVFPAAWFELAVGLPIIWLLWRWLRQRLDPGRWLTAAILLMLPILMVSRYLNNNYLSAVMLLAVAAYAFTPPVHERS